MRKMETHHTRQLFQSPIVQHFGMAVKIVVFFVLSWQEWHQVWSSAYILSSQTTRDILRCHSAEIQHFHLSKKITADRIFTLFKAIIYKFMMLDYYKYDFWYCWADFHQYRYFWLKNKKPPLNWNWSISETETDNLWKEKMSKEKERI